MKRLLLLAILAACTQPPRPCLQGSVLNLESDALKDPKMVEALQQADPWEAQCEMMGQKAKVAFSPGALQRLVENCEFNRQR